MATPKEVKPRTGTEKLQTSLTFILISNMMEHVVCEQLGDHVSKMGNLEVLQSAYKAGHSTETALPKVKTDIMNAMDNKEVT